MASITYDTSFTCSAASRAPTGRGIAVLVSGNSGAATT
jgi:hypothetical protein